MQHAIVPCVLLVSCFVSFAVAAETAVPARPSPEQIKAWRKEGPTAVDRLMREREKLLAEVKQAPKDDVSTLLLRERVDKLNETIDQVAEARYSHESGLYWYTDEAEANRAAKAEGKPVLALRLLGNLNDELSCANSRYFRILLYPDDKLRQLLRDKFILTWKSARPVPKITIDLGDGRKVERTITGNSVHYVVLPDGQVVDVFPGLYGPVPLFERLVKAETAAQRAMRAKDARTEIIAYQQQQIAQLKQAWKADLAKYETWRQEAKQTEPSADSVGYAPPVPLTFWEVVAKFHPQYSELSEASVALVKREEKVGKQRARETVRPTSDLDFAFSKGGDEVAISMLVACIQPTMQADTVYNEYCGRYRALQYLIPVPASAVSEAREPLGPFEDDGRPFAVGVVPGVAELKPLDKLNDFVYSQIFHYSLDDPWIGMARFDSLTALPKDRGLKRESRKQ